MQDQLTNFVAKAREHGLTDEDIRRKLEEQGWHAADIDKALGEEELLVPKPAYAGSTPAPHTANAPVSVVENLTPKGFEYKLFSVVLTIALVGFVIFADLLIGGDDMSAAAFPLTLLIVTGPIAAYLFTRLRKAEVMNPALKHDPSRRKGIQAIQLIAFLAMIVHSIILLYMVISGHYTTTYPVYSGSSYTSTGPNLTSDVLRWAVTMIVAGGMFGYYWNDEHRHN